MSSRFPNPTGFLAYREPGSEPVYLKVQQSTSPEAAFVLYPFDGDKPAQFWQLEECQKAEIVSFFNSLGLPKAPSNKSPDKQQYLRSVQKSLDEIRAGRLKKVVISRRITQSIDSISPVEVWERACEKYPDTFAYVFYTPETGCWMGASPEKLLSYTPRELHTVSLAATRWQSQNELDWSAKEREEQQWVTDYFLEKFEDAEVQSIKTDGPNDYEVGHLTHLRTDFYVKIQNGRMPLDWASHLHPSPAVCGVPADKALDFIRENEGYKRDYYAGFLGTYSREQASFFVNLRCMQFYDSAVVLYAGGGLTADSNPEREWVETEQKMDTLLSLLNV